MPASSCLRGHVSYLSKLARVMSLRSRILKPELHEKGRIRCLRAPAFRQRHTCRSDSHFSRASYTVAPSQVVSARYFHSYFPSQTTRASASATDVLSFTCIALVNMLGAHTTSQRTVLCLLPHRYASDPALFSIEVIAGEFIPLQSFRIVSTASNNEQLKTHLPWIPELQLASSRSLGGGR